MAREYSMTIPGQPWFGSRLERTVEVHYAEPEGGAGADTGLLLLIAGFDGDVKTNVYRKMRMEFADRENLVTVQCSYFGSRFMGADIMRVVRGKMTQMELELRKKVERGESVPEVAMETLELDESGDDFCEMGLFQALDNLRALKAVMEILDCRGEGYDRGRIIAYGYSHGAYLGLLCNALAPWLFSGIIDNSGWTYPVYLYRPRINVYSAEDSNTDIVLSVAVLIKYRGREWIDDMEPYHLRRLYRHFQNNARILSFQGESDRLVPLREKESFAGDVENMRLTVVRKEDVDGEMFTNTEHGMGSDFLKFFYYVISGDSLRREMTAEGEVWCERQFSSGRYVYILSENLELERRQ